MAGILACGNDAAADHRSTVLHHWGAALSHRSAAALWQLLPAPDGPVDISVPGEGGRRKRRGIRVHRRRSLLPAYVTRHRGIPVTTPACTISDLRRIASPRDLHRAIRQAGVLGLPIDTEAVPDRTRSELEWLFLKFCQRHDLPMPEVNVWIDSLQVDFLWRDQRLIVETDGYKFHRGRAAFEEDRDRDLRLKAHGYEVVRLTYRQVADRPKQVAKVLAAALI